MTTTIIIIDGEKVERQDAAETYKPRERYDITDKEAVQAAQTLADYCKSHICDDCMFPDSAGNCALFLGVPYNWELPL